MRCIVKNTSDETDNRPKRHMDKRAAGWLM